ncbi:MAG: ArsR/SmtB family transcription factor [Candidatus Bathyarchaeia archaeon]
MGTSEEKVVQIIDPKIMSAIKVFKALSDPTRITILKKLQDEERCICEFVDVVGLSQPAVSYHFGILADAGLITVRKEGRRVICWARKRGLLDQLLKAVESLEE